MSYLDSEYFVTNHFTEKSHVYSFGVVLIELLTGQKSIKSTRSEEEKSLIAYFTSSLEQNRLFEGNDRPNMKEVTKELEDIRISVLHQRNGFTITRIHLNLYTML